ncbi:hypothetical protein R3P38DRAFT_3394715 [Favolaschia claudopus]|uniref:Reverse transcriptase n=1 Tax=Favolaschia claudopus TaxID=2862362 RepID=A0AAW0BTI2_9AGAR
MGCPNPGECIETARAMLQCIPPKWSSVVDSHLTDALNLSENDRLANEGNGTDDELPLTFDPSLRLTEIGRGFRIFASEDHLQAEMYALISLRKSNEPDETLSLRLSFDDWNPFPSFNTALLGGLLHILQNVPMNAPLTISSSTAYLGATLVKHRNVIENNTVVLRSIRKPILGVTPLTNLPFRKGALMLDTNFRLIQCVIATLRERSAKTHFRQVKYNRAPLIQAVPAIPTTLDIQPDLMFSMPGISLSQGNQRLFTKIILLINSRARRGRKSTTANLDRARCCIADEFNFFPSDATIWRSIRSTDISRVIRNFLWKGMHDCFRIGLFWDKHILLECDIPGQRLIWRLGERIWRLRYSAWPKLTLGLLLGCALPKFKSSNGKLVTGKNRFFTILISTSMYLICCLRNERIFERDTPATNLEIHNRWISVMNAALKRDQILSNRFKFGNLARKEHVVLETWSGVLLNEDSLPDNWINERGVLVGIRPATRNDGVG